MRKIIIIWLFTEEERTAILNSLWRRHHDYSTKYLKGDAAFRELCAKLGLELMR